MEQGLELQETLRFAQSDKKNNQTLTKSFFGSAKFL